MCTIDFCILQRLNPFSTTYSTITSFSALASTDRYYYRTSTVTKDFWAFYNAFPVAAFGSPRWLYPAEYHSGDLMLHILDTWRRCNANSIRVISAGLV